MKVGLQRINAVIAAPKPPSIVQAIPIYMKSDRRVFAYFHDNTDEIDQITGTVLIIPWAEEVEIGNTSAISALFSSSLGLTRYPGLRRGDLPCLWLEDSTGGHEIVRLPDNDTDIGAVLRTLTDAAAAKTTARDIKAEMNRSLKANLREQPFLSVLLSELPVSKSSERLIAVGFGVVFVTAILILAIVFPTPTPFQYLVFRIVLALAAAGFVSMTPGFIEITVSNWLRAGGALGVFAVVFFYNPAALVTAAPPSDHASGATNASAHP